MKVGYAFVSFWPTGETRNYDATKGEIRPSEDPRTRSPAGGWGGVELALRYDYADLTDAYETASDRRRAHASSQDAGKYTAWTLGRELLPDRLRPLAGQLHQG